MFYIVPGPKKSLRWSNSYVLNNNVFYTQVASASVPDNTDAFFLFLPQKDFDIFRTLLFEAFLCLFLYLFTIFIYTKKFTKNIF